MRPAHDSSGFSPVRCEPFQDDRAAVEIGSNLWGFIDRTGKAFGVLSTLQIAPAAGSNGVGDLSKELAYANAHGAGVTLANGTEAFTGPLLSANPPPGR